LGDVVFDENLNLSNESDQESLLNLCLELRNQTFVASEQVTCWIEEFDDFVKQKYKITENKKRYNPITL